MSRERRAADLVTRLEEIRFCGSYPGTSAIEQLRAAEEALLASERAAIARFVEATMDLKGNEKVDVESLLEAGR